MGVELYRRDDRLDARRATRRVNGERGPYRYTRNPLYLGNLAQAIGIGMLGPWPVAVLLVALMLAYSFVLISVEETYLARKNGTAYAAYREKVPQLVPIPGRIAQRGGQHGSWRAGLFSERVLGIVTIVVSADIVYQSFGRGGQT